MKFEMLVRMGQRIVCHQRGNMGELSGFRFQELLARRRVEKQITYGDRRTVRKPASSTRKIFPPLISTTMPSAPRRLESPGSRRETEAIDGRASPRNPKVERLAGRRRP